MKLKALWTSKFDSRWEDYFNNKFEVTKAGAALNPDSRFSVVSDVDKLKALVADKDVLILGFEPITREILQAAPNLKVILSERDGPEENIDIEACTEFGIPVLSAGGRCAESVAELNIALMFALARKIPYLNEKFHEAGWPMRDSSGDAIYAAMSAQFALSSKTLSIIGFGRNGRRLAELVKGFNMNILIYDPYVSDQACQEYGVTSVSLEEAMSQGDFICVLARVTPETTGMLNRELLSMMKPTAFFVNCGRAALTDEQAVYDIVKDGKIAGAALDVFSQEKPGDMPIFCDLPSDRMILTPHVAGMSDRRVYYQYTFMVDGFESYIKGEKTFRCYNPKVYDSPNFAAHGGVVFGMEK